MEDDGAQPLVAPPAAVPELPAVTAARGARFAGAAEQDGPAEPPPRERIGADDVREVGRLVHTLTRLRREARSGEAHALLNRAAYWPAVRFPPLADAMERAGLAADWATLLWEAAATLPAERLVAAADALTAGGRAEDGEQILRQGVVRLRPTRSGTPPSPSPTAPATASCAPWSTRAYGRAPRRTPPARPHRTRDAWCRCS